MKSNKGFTLIELLAVIVILAIIALIATPIILDVIDTAKKGAKESSALGYIDAVEKKVMLDQIEVTDADARLKSSTTDYDVQSDGKLKMGSTTYDVEVKGEAPTSGTLKIGDKGAVTEAKLQFDGYCVTYSTTPAEGKKNADASTGTCA